MAKRVFMLVGVLLLSFVFLARGEEEDSVESTTNSIQDPCGIYNSVCTLCLSSDDCFYDIKKKKCISKSLALIDGYCNDASSIIPFKGANMFILLLLSWCFL